MFSPNQTGLSSINANHHCPWKQLPYSGSCSVLGAEADPTATGDHTRLMGKSRLSWTARLSSASSELRQTDRRAPFCETRQSETGARYSVQSPLPRIRCEGSGIAADNVPPRPSELPRSPSLWESLFPPAPSPLQSPSPTLQKAVMSVTRSSAPSSAVASTVGMTPWRRSPRKIATRFRRGYTSTPPSLSSRRRPLSRFLSWVIRVGAVCLPRESLASDR